MAHRRRPAPTPSTSAEAAAARHHKPHLRLLLQPLLLLLLGAAGGARALKTDFIQAQGPVSGFNLTINSNFAYGLDLNKDGSVLAVGAPFYPLTQNFGAAFVYHYIKRADGWVNATTQLRGSHIGQNSFFGADVALNDKGNLLVISAPAFKPAGTGEGSFYTYVMNDQYQWTERYGPIRGSGQNGGSNFGAAVGLSGDGRVLVVGGNAYNNGEGAIWIFSTSPTTGQATEVQGPVQPTTGNGMNAFGTEVAVSKKGDVIVVSGTSYNVNEGALWVFRSQTLYHWVQEAGPLQPTSGALVGLSLGSFGNLDINGKGDVIAAGAQGLEQATGGVYIWSYDKARRRRDGGWKMVQGPIQGTNLELGDQFGMGLKLDNRGKTLLIGAPAYGMYSEGAFYIFKGKAGSRRGYRQAQGPVLAENGGDNFARTLSLSGDGRVASLGSTSWATSQGAVWNYVN